MKLFRGPKKQGSEYLISPFLAPSNFSARYLKVAPLLHPLIQNSYIYLRDFA